MQPLISVIVPIYKVEAYLRQCIDSILVQTYKNLEVILVDDGSPDYCPEICNEYAEKDDRIRVIHKENGGLSDARNAGIVCAHGEYISFIDSDDWILPDMLEYLYKGIETYEADITVCGYFDCYGKRMSTTYRQDIQIFTGHEAVEALLLLKFPNFAWNKLYKKELWSKESRFPKGKVYEDVRTIYRLIDPDTTVAVLPEARYCYRKRSDSITGVPSLQNKIESVEARIERFLFLAEDYPNAQNFMLKDICKYLPGLRNAVLKNNRNEYEIHRDDLQKISDFLKLYAERISKIHHLGRLGRISYKCMSHGTRNGWIYSKMITGVIKYRQKIFRILHPKKRKPKKSILNHSMCFLKIKKTLLCFYWSLRDFCKNGWKRRNARYARFYKSIPLKDKTVLYESFWGRGMVCGPYALFQHMINHPEYANFQHIWVLDNPREYTDLFQRFQSSPNVRFVKYMSRQYLRELCQSKYLINNAAFPSFYTKREGQVYIHTWHGIPLKKLGFDLQDGVKQTHNAIRNFLQVDYLISANPFLTEIYKYTYKLDGLFRGTIIEEGYPRLDSLVRYDKDTLLRQLERCGVRIKRDKKIIVYAPTWREIDKDPAEVLKRYRSIKETIELEIPEYQVLIKAHQYVYKLIKESSKVDYIIPSTIDANEVLPIADILIGDYSSIYFDYLYFQRPILFYIPDLQEYLEYRGLYFSLDNLPGPYTEKLEDIIKWLHNIDSVYEQYQSKLEDARRWSCTEHAGDISQKVLDIVMNKGGSGKRVIERLDTKKKKILIHRGRMKSNWISRYLLNSLSQVDFDRFDVSVIVLEGKNAEEKQLIEEIDPRVRVLMRRSTFNLTFSADVQERRQSIFGAKNTTSRNALTEVYQTEIRRCFGDTQFDMAIDFDGTKLSYGMLIAQIPGAVHCLFQYYDLTVDGKKGKSIIPTLYPYFDKIVFCKQELLESNKQVYGTEDIQNKFVLAKSLNEIIGEL